jgi:hypothetical protein
MKVYTDLSTLKKAWRIVKELNLEALLMGGKIELNVVDFIDDLLDNDKLKEFCQVITKSEDNFEEMQLGEVMEIIADFFGATGSAFRKVQSQVDTGINK